MPTANAQTTVLGFERERAGGDAEAQRVEQRTQARREPDAGERGRGPTPRIPIASASSAIDQSTCPRDAPIARSSADSRVRWAMMIENVL